MSTGQLTLGIYTAGDVEVAVVAGERTSTAGVKCAALESLIPLITQVLGSVNCSIEDIRLVGVCTGPGSFTGLRIGVTFAKSLAQARNLPIVGVSTYDVVSHDVTRAPQVSVAEGKPEYYYARIIDRPGVEPRYVQGDREAIVKAANEMPGDVSIRGAGFSATDVGMSSLAVARLACQAFATQPTQSWTQVAIDYGQRPNAEVNWERRHAAVKGGSELSRREPGRG